MEIHVADSIKKDPETYDEFMRLAKQTADFYKKITTRQENPIPREDARDILPIGWKCNLVMTMNCRELLHFFHERLCIQAQKEIRILANKMLNICRTRLPEVFSNVGPKCLNLGYCNEGDRSCHLRPTKEDVFEIFHQYKETKN